MLMVYHPESNIVREEVTLSGIYTLSTSRRFNHVCRVSKKISKQCILDVYAFVGDRVRVCACACACVCVRVFVCACVCACVCLRACGCVCVRACVCVRIMFTYRIDKLVFIAFIMRMYPLYINS